VAGRVRAVAFDVGNTLWFQRAEPDADLLIDAQRATIEPMLERWGVRLPFDLRDVLRDVLDASLIPYEAYDASLREIDLPRLIRGALAVRDVEITEAQAHEWWRAAYVPVRDNFAIELYPDTLDVLRELHEEGFRSALCTNRPFTGEMFRRDMDDYGIARYIDVIVCSGDTGYVKPHPSMYEMTLRLLDVAAADALFVGDSCEVDLEGARAAGMPTAWKLNGRYDPPPCAAADYAIHDLAELLALPPIGLRAAPEGASPTPHEDENEERY
jgi:HAD superfamily hydrolase (TIGR01509 family)